MGYYDFFLDVWSNGKLFSEIDLNLSVYDNRYTHFHKLKVTCF